MYIMVSKAYILFQLLLILRWDMFSQSKHVYSSIYVNHIVIERVLAALPIQT